MNIVQQGPTPNASATARGVVTPGAQVIGGVKTFTDDIQLSIGKGLVQDPGSNNFFRDLGGSWYTALNTRLDVGGFYVASGGVLAGLNNQGLSAAAGSYGADVTQTQTYPVQIASANGAIAGVCVKVGSTQASPHAAAELLRVGYGLGGFAGSDGTAVFQVFGDGHVEIPKNDVNGYLWIKSGNGVFLNLAGTKRLYYDGANIAANGDFKTYGNLEFTNDLRFSGVAVMSPRNYAGFISAGYSGAPNPGSGKAGHYFGVANPLSAGEDLIRACNGVPDVAATVFTVRQDGLVLASGGIGVGNSAAASGPVGSVVKKIQVFDASGTSLGFVPVYNTIT